MSDEKKTVLVVDDDIDFLTQMEINFQGAGYTVETAEGQGAAEKKLKTLKPDIAVVDLMMENPDGGFALSYHIKKVSPKTKVILVTAVTSETGLEFDATTEEEQSWVKADAFLAKPIRFEQLLREINKIN